MITINQIQAAIVARIKESNIPLMLADVNGVVRSDEVRAYQWQGTKFHYPAIRVKVHNTKPLSTACERVAADGSILVLGENPSALLINDVGSALLELFHGKPFKNEYGSYSAIMCEHIGGDRVEESGVWVSEVKFSLNAA
jgi:hypothetical protein